MVVPTLWSYAVLNQPALGDFNNDGKTDIATWSSGTGDFSVYLSTGSAFTGPTVWGNASVPGISCRLDAAYVGSGDFNGDGITDVVCKKVSSAAILVGWSDGSQFTFWNYNPNGFGCDYGERNGSIDFDGDGRDDWYCISPGGAFYAFANAGTEFVFPSFGYLDGSFCAQSDYIFADLNADGRTDLSSKGNGNVALSSGRAFYIQGGYGG